MRRLALLTLLAAAGCNSGVAQNPTFMEIEAQRAAVAEEAKQYKAPWLTMRPGRGGLWKDGSLDLVDRPKVNLVQMEAELLDAYRTGDKARLRKVLLTYQVNHQKGHTSPLFEPHFPDAAKYLATFATPEKKALIEAAIKAGPAPRPVPVTNMPAAVKLNPFVTP